MSIPLAVSFLVNLVYLDESPRVLMIRGHFDRGYEILIKTARVSGRLDVVEKLEKEVVK
jgi:hypothetical protein